jgi:hypothetical protein
VAGKDEQLQPRAILIENKSSRQSLIPGVRGNFALPVITLELSRQ